MNDSNDKSVREYRMYGLVPYNISPIQQGIQFGHAVVEYSLLYSNDTNYQKWAKVHKTFIILNGGTTNIQMPGTLNVHEYDIEANSIKHANFFEPDLGDQLTAVVFLVDDRIFDKKKWPDYKDVCKEFLLKGDNDHIPPYDDWYKSFSDDMEELVKIHFLREFLNQFRLA